MELIVTPICNLLLVAIKLYSFTVVAYIILSWLKAFGIVDNSNQLVYSVGNFLASVVDPVLNKIRRFLPNLSGIDLSPIVLFLILFFVQDFIMILVRRLVTGI